MSIFHTLRQIAPALAQGARILSQAPTPEAGVKVGITQSRRLSYHTPDPETTTKPSTLREARARVLASTRADISKPASDAKGCEPASDAKSISPADPKGPLNQAAVMTKTYRGQPCNAFQLRGIHKTQANADHTLNRGLSPVGNWYPDNRYDLERATQVQAGFVTTIADRRAKVMQSPTRLDLLPAGISLTSDPSIALRFGERNPDTQERERGQAIIFVIDIRHKRDLVDHREISQRGIAGSEKETTWFGDVPSQCILGYYQRATEDTSRTSVYEPMGLEWVPNLGYKPVHDGKIFKDKS